MRDSIRFIHDEHSEYASYRMGFLIGTGSCFSLIPAYPSSFIDNYSSYVDPSNKDSLDIFHDWKIVGEDIDKSIEIFEKEMKIGRRK